MTTYPAAGEVDRATLHAGLIARYQDALARADGRREDVDADGRQALADLVADMSPLLRAIALEKITARFGLSGARPAELLEDAVAEMVAAVLDAAATFDPDRCAVFHSWVLGEQGVARAALFAGLNFADGWGEVPERTRRTLAIARQAESRLTESLGRSPTTAELQQEMTDYCFRYQFERLSPAQQQLPEEQWRKIARGKLVNNGLIAGIRDIATLRANAARPVSPEEFATGWDFVESTRDSSEVTRSALETSQDHADAADLVRVAMAGLDPTDRSILAARLAPEDDADPSFTAIAERHRVSVAHVKAAVADAAARMGAGHAHYAFLAPGVGAQFEEAPAADPGAAGMLRRLQPTLA